VQRIQAELSCHGTMQNSVHRQMKCALAESRALKFRQYWSELPILERTSPSQDGD
jgi:hypothetical protein